ncbi:EcsC family protein [Moraxella nasovis]|uniref:EcsC family protein n=1 Tax=Moraxella nasovis TaxID=2904121 RepID=UPI001F607C46|nr:EcsC family protein [Moraxella nasovis]UNU72867.1 EcsC family protein [Moraxella nasovis]
MSRLISAELMQEVLEWSYDKAVNGVASMGSAKELGDDYLKQSGSLEDRINALIRWQNTKAGGAGFLSGMGGMITLPVALPMNIVSTLYVQIRMVAAIAHMAGFDIHHDKVKTLVFICLLGQGVTEFIKDTSVTLATKTAQNYIAKNITTESLKQINKAVGFRLVTKAGEKGVINLTKMVPIIGGVVSGGLDVFTTNLVGNTARDTFLGMSPDFINM